MEQKKYIKINVSGRSYVLSSETIKKLPTIANILLVCDAIIGNDEYFIERSPLLFDHVLAYVIDDTYKYPIELYTELDFYDVKYDMSKLYDRFDKITELMNQKLDILENMIAIHADDIPNSKWDCRFCNNLISAKKIFCKKCANNRGKLCIYKGTQTCNNVSLGNYCDKHLDMGILCQTLGCANIRIKSKKFCYLHNIA